ncbi:MAG: DegT/DnrJ/EryC1/StrS family aminotransferase [Patescibacteria group bacterium]
MKIPLYKPDININDIKAAVKVLKSGKLSRGKYTEKFEKKFAKYTNKKYAISLNSGTSGLQVLVRAVGWKEGDEIITSPFSYVASSNILLLEKIKPIFVDIDPKTLNINIKKIKEKINPKTKGILLVHILGLPVDYSDFIELKNKYNLGIIEDACETIGRPKNNFRVGDFGIATVYAFHENKQLTTGGEGGMITTDDPLLAEKCGSMRDQGRSERKDWINHVILGFNFRMTEMQAAIGLSQLQRIDKILQKRENAANYYTKLFNKSSDIITPKDLNCNLRSWFSYYILLKDEDTRNKLKKGLEKINIATNDNCFPPIYNFSMYKKLNINAREFEITEDVSRRLLVLPFFNDIRKSEIDYMVYKIKELLKK